MKWTQKTSSMTKQLITSEQTYATYNEDTGLIEVRDKITGNLVGLYDDAAKLGKAEALVPIRLDNGDLIYMTPGIFATKLKRYSRYAYTPHLADLIADKVVEGYSLSEMGKLFAYIPPYSVLWRWRKQFPEFAQKLEDAFEARAELTRDEIAREAKEAPSLDKDEIPGAKLSIDTKKWLAEKDGPKKYSGKTKIEAEVRAQVLTIDTGIRREGDAGYNKDYSREVIDGVTQLGVNDVGDKNE